MDSIVQNILGRLPDVYDKSKFNRNDLIAVMQGITGFAKAFAGKNPLDLIDTSLSLTAALAHKQCLKSLDA